MRTDSDSNYSVSARDSDGDEAMGLPVDLPRWSARRAGCAARQRYLPSESCNQVGWDLACTAGLPVCSALEPVGKVGRDSGRGKPQGLLESPLDSAL
jgi:hypothetical protein